MKTMQPLITIKYVPALIQFVAVLGLGVSARADACRYVCSENGAAVPGRPAER
jgi:hypothetical protein